MEVGSWNPDEQRKEVRESPYVPMGSFHHSHTHSSGKKDEFGHFELIGKARENAGKLHGFN